MSVLHTIVKLSMELGLAVSEYNSENTESLEEVMKLTLAYLAKVKEAVHLGKIGEEELQEYFALVGQSWASIQPRFLNEYTTEKEEELTKVKKVG